MFGALLQAIGGYFGRAFVLGALLPILVIEVASLALALEITRGLGASLDDWTTLPAGLQTISVLVAVLLAVVVAYVLHNLSFAITRLFEGYWPSRQPFRWLRNRRSEFHKRCWRYLEHRARTAPTPSEQNEIYALQSSLYPPPAHLDKTLPTRLGNILRASEVYAYDRYGIDSAIIWTRLRPILSAEAVAPLEESKLTRDFMLLMSVVSGAFALVWCPLLAALTDRWELFLACAAGVPLAWIFYRNALQSSLAYGEFVRAIFDLHRKELLQQLGRPIPPTALEEEEWLKLTRFFSKNLPLSFPARKVATLPAPPPLLTKPRDPVPFVGWTTTAAAVAALSLWMAVSPESQVRVPVPRHDVAAFRLLGERDVAEKSVDAVDARGAARSAAAVVGRYAVEPLHALHPVPAQALAPRRDERLLAGRVAVTVPHVRPWAAAERLRRGDVVSLTVVSRRTHVFPRTLVLDADPGAGWVVVAIPRSRLEEYSSAAHATYVVARPIR